MPTPQENQVKERYASAAQQLEPALCCPVDYDPQLLKAIPPEVIERDYGCGDPSRYLQEGERVLDLGSGTGKVCFMASQVVGPKGKVIGVDMTDDMLEVARRNAPLVAQNIGYSNVEFKKGRIQDLSLDLELWDRHLASHSIESSEAYLKAIEQADRLRRESPLVPSESVDVVISNCVLNLVESDEKKKLFTELFRVIRSGGRAVISDIVSDEVVPASMQADSELWSGCISGALSEQAFLAAFEEVGFYGIRLVKRDPRPWRVVEGIEFRSITVEAFKGDQGPCLERHQAAIYRGPFRSVTDDDGNTYYRGQAMAICDRTYQRLGQEPYATSFETLQPAKSIAVEDAVAFDCSTLPIRSPEQLKGSCAALDSTEESGSCCC